MKESKNLKRKQNKPKQPKNLSVVPDLRTEEDVLAFWDTNRIFLKSIEARKKGKEYSFYDGPPFATGKPHYGHILTTTIKDTVTRFWTMKGFKVERRVGWDCHGLPVESLIEKEMGIRSKRDIEAMGIEEFNAACRKAVFRSVDDFEKTLKRVGRWADYSNAYATLDLPYMESVWWVFKQIYDQGLAYQDFRVTPYCPRCGTPLSNFEVNLNYKENTEDPSVYVKFKIPDSRASFLVWTTTPWTLHGNVALAVDPKAIYVRVKHGGEESILAKARLSVLGSGAEILEEMTGTMFVGKQYTSLYPSGEAQEKAYRVIAGDFVSMDDGTGIVHIAPAFGEDDYRMSKKFDLPLLNNISGEGRFVDVKESWNGKKVKDADKDIIEDLRSRGLLFKSEKIRHTYPFCWRCEHYLIYYAVKSWYIGVTKVKKELLANNKQIGWTPKHLKDGRFGKWLEGARDWAVSRSRFWGSPLPVWRCESCGTEEVFGNINDLAKRQENNTTLYVVRHGESEHNIKDVCSGDISVEYHLTAKGRKQIHTLAKTLKHKGIEVIVSSDFLRTKETSEILAETLGIPAHYDARLRDINVGDYEGADRTTCRLEQSKAPILYEYRFPNGESMFEVETRMMATVRDIEKQFPGKKVLIVSHEDPIKTLYAAHGLVRNRDVHSVHLDKGSVHVFESKMPNDLHRPFIDHVVIPCPKGDGQMKRIPDVFDCWFESGSMPYAQWHYPFENKDLVERTFPADFIGEGLDQTRGWFYTLHVLATILTRKNTRLPARQVGLGKNKPAFKNVIVNGLILASDGKKLSKRLKNYPEPEELFSKFGADSVRLFLLTATAMGEDYRLSDKGVENIYRNVVLIAKNVLNFYETYAEKAPSAKRQAPSALDRWIMVRLEETTDAMTKAMEAYDLTKASRPLLDFVTDLSTWYVRRSRDRIKSSTEREIVSSTLRQVLEELSKLMAPFMPFTAEMIYQKVKDENGRESVHLEDWPKTGKGQGAKSVKLLKEMEAVRKIVELGHRVRREQNIKVRQPLSQLQIEKQKISKDLIQIIADELNIKQVDVVDKFSNSNHWVIMQEGNVRIAVMTNISPELRQEGLAREIIRSVNGLRKELNLTPNDIVEAVIDADDEDLRKVLEDWKSEICEKCRFKSFELRKVSEEAKILQIGEKEIKILIQKL